MNRNVDDNVVDGISNRNGFYPVEDSEGAQ